MRFLAEYDNQKSGKYTLFNNDIDLYWAILGIMQFFYFFFLLIKYFLLSIVTLYSN